MTATSSTVDLLAHNFNLGVIDFFAYFKPPQPQDLPGRSPLHALVREGDLLAVEALIEKGADCNRPDGEGRVPLHEAAAAGDVGMLSFLLDAGAQIDAAIAPMGHTALYLAVEGGHLPAAQLLIASGAKLGAADGITGQGLLHMTAARGDMRLAGLLIAAGADVYAEDRKGRTPRDYAARANHAELERALLKVMEHRARA